MSGDGGCPQTPRQQQGGALAVPSPAGMELLHGAVLTDLDKVGCQQGLCQRSLQAAAGASAVPSAHTPGCAVPVGGSSSAGPARAPPWAVEGDPTRFCSLGTRSGVAGVAGAAACWVPLVTCQSPSRPSLTCFSLRGSARQHCLNKAYFFIFCFLRSGFFLNLIPLLLKYQCVS